MLHKVLICSDPLPRCHAACGPPLALGRGRPRASLQASPMPAARRRRFKHQAWKPQNPRPSRMLAPSIRKGLRPVTVPAALAGENFPKKFSVRFVPFSCILSRYKCFKAMFHEN